MTTIVIGGHSRKVGKTSVTEGLIRELHQYPWTAVKISSHWHADPAVTDAFLIHEESPGSGNSSDTARYLRAGASRAFWMQVRPQHFANALPTLLSIMHSGPYTIVESNAILHHICPELYVMVLRYDVDEFKASARDSLVRANAIIAIDSGESIPAWKDGIRAAMEGIPVFTTPIPGKLPAGFIDFVKARLGI